MHGGCALGGGGGDIDDVAPGVTKIKSGHNNFIEHRLGP